MVCGPKLEAVYALGLLLRRYLLLILIHQGNSLHFVFLEGVEVVGWSISIRRTRWNILWHIVEIQSAWSLTWRLVRAVQAGVTVVWDRAEPGVYSRL